MLAGDGGGQRGRLRLDLSHTLAADFHYLGDRTNREGDVNAHLLSDVELHAFGLIPLESFCRDDYVVRASGQTGDDIRAVCICGCIVCQVCSCARDDHLGADNGCAGFVGDGAADIAGVLRV